MVKSIFSGIAELVGGWLEDMVRLILGWISMDTSKVDAALPGLMQTRNIILALGICAVMGCLIVEILQLVTSPLTGQERKGGIQSIIRAITSGILIAAVFPMTKYILSFIQDIYLQIMAESWTGLGMEEATDSISNGLEALGVKAAQLGVFLMSLIFFIIMFVQILKIGISLLTKYVTYSVCIYLGPLCMGFYASPTTTNITVSWLKTLLAQVVLFLTTAWGLKVMFISLQNPLLEGESIITRYLYVFILSKVILKLEDILKSLGFNTMPNPASVRTGLMSTAALLIGGAKTFNHIIGRHTGSAYNEGSGGGNRGRGNSPASGHMAASMGQEPPRAAQPAGPEGKTGPATKTVKGGTINETAQTASKPEATQGIGFAEPSRKDVQLNKEQKSQIKKGGNAEATPAQAQARVNRRMEKMEPVDGATLNRAFAGSEGISRNYRFIPGAQYTPITRDVPAKGADGSETTRKVSDNALYGKVQYRQSNGEWSTQESVISFNGGGVKQTNQDGRVTDESAQKVMRMENGDYGYVSSDRYFDLSSDGSITLNRITPVRDENADAGRKGKLPAGKDREPVPSKPDKAPVAAGPVKAASKTDAITKAASAKGTVSGAVAGSNKETPVKENAKVRTDKDSKSKGGD